MTEATIDTDLIPADLHACLDDLARHLATGAALRGKGLRWISRADQATPEGSDPRGALALAISVLGYRKRGESGGPDAPECEDKPESPEVEDGDSSWSP